MARQRRSSGWVDLSRFFWVPLDQDTRDAAPDAGRASRAADLPAWRLRDDRVVVEGRSGLYLVTKTEQESTWRCICWDSVRGTPICKHQVAAAAASASRGEGSDPSLTEARRQQLADTFLPPRTSRQRAALLQEAQDILTQQSSPSPRDPDLTALVGRVLNIPALRAEEVLPLLAGSTSTVQLLLAMNVARMTLGRDPQIRTALLRLVHAPASHVNDHATALGILVLANSPVEEHAPQWHRLITHHGPLDDSRPLLPGERGGSGVPLHIQAAFLAAVPGLAAHLGAKVLRPLLLHEDRSVREAVLRALRTPGQWDPRPPLPAEPIVTRRQAPVSPSPTV